MTWSKKGSEKVREIHREGNIKIDRDRNVIDM